MDSNNIKQEILSFLKDFCMWGITTFLVFLFVFQAICVSGSSMDNTLHDGNLLIGTRINREYHRGDIVVAKTTSQGNTRYIIKRVIGVPGDHIVIDYLYGNVYINGEIIDEPYIREKMQYSGWGEMELTFDISEDCLFLMGDNRNRSLDSREIGEVPIKDISSRIIWSLVPFKNVE